MSCRYPAFGMIERPVMGIVARAVDEDHKGDRDTAEDVEG